MGHELITLAIVVVGIFICVKGVMVEQMIERLPKWARGPAYLAATIVWLAGVVAILPTLGLIIGLIAGGGGGAE
jgi:uncharacterized membrane protein